MVPSFIANKAPRVRPDSRSQEILSGQVKLLYASASVSVGVSILASTILGYLQWRVIPNRIVLLWWLYMFLLSIGRGILALGYRRGSPESEARYWNSAFALGAGLAGAGWGAAGVLLYPAGPLANQVFLVFVLGGMMLGAGSLLAPRPEAFLPFLIPAGLAPAVRLLIQGGQTHLGMGVLAVVFTLATVVTTWRIYRTIDASLRLQFENRDLVVDLQAAKSQTEALNQALEIRVQERTAELRHSTELLRAEFAQRRQMEEEVLRARKLESLGVLAGGIAHDFNNFLTIVRGNIEVAQSALEPGHDVQDALEQAASTCQRAAQLSSRLLTFAKGGAPVRSVMPVAALVTDAVRLARAGSATAMVVEIAKDLRPACVDPAQIGQVLHNILLNARQAMSEGGTIEIRAENLEIPSGPGTAPHVRISIRDHGAGIAADVLPRIFDPYFTTKAGGSGLGLATAYSIIARHDGHIFVESKPGEGTLFTIELPASLERPAPEASTSAGPRRGTRRILVMDDEEGLRKLMKIVLTNLGYAAETAREGGEAIALYEAAQAGGQGFDAVLLDLTVGVGMGGIETASRLKALDPAAKLIMSSGYSGTAAMSDFGRYGFDAVIPKPWTPAKMSEVLTGVFEGGRERPGDQE